MSSLYAIILSEIGLWTFGCTENICLGLLFLLMFHPVDMCLVLESFGGGSWEGWSVVSRMSKSLQQEEN